MMTKPKVAIIGAGIAGLSAACALKDHADVTVFDKSRGVGGRMSTRYAGDWEFDHGAQYFTVQTQLVADAIAPFVDGGVLKPWQPTRIHQSEGRREPLKTWTHPRYVANGRMNALPKAMAKDLDIKLGARVTGLRNQMGKWLLDVEDCGEGHGPFDWVIVSAPAPQTHALMPDNFAHKASVQQSVLRPCHALMLGFGDVEAPDWQAVEVSNSPLAWVARNDSKPGRGDAAAFLCHTSADWSAKVIEHEPTELIPKLLSAFQAATGISSKPDYVSIHRWRYALTTRSAGSRSLFDGDNRLIACGDWCVGGKVEAAFESGLSAAHDLLAHVGKSV